MGPTKKKEKKVKTNKFCIIIIITQKPDGILKLKIGTRSSGFALGHFDRFMRAVFSLCLSH